MQTHFGFRNSQEILYLPLGITSDPLNTAIVYLYVLFVHKFNNNAIKQHLYMYVHANYTSSNNLFFLPFFFFFLLFSSNNLFFSFLRPYQLDTTCMFYFLRCKFTYVHTCIYMCINPLHFLAQSVVILILLVTPVSLARVCLNGRNISFRYDAIF